jgi:RNA polymerase sigma-70 factor, ECF subfamily
MPFLRTDPELLEGFRRGDPRSLERVYLAYVHSVQRRVRQLVRTTHAPELAQASTTADLVQDVFVRAFGDTARHQYDPSRDYEPYLVGIARHRWVDLLRARGREVLTSPEAMEDSAVPVELEAPGDLVVLSVLRDYVASLPEPLRVVYEQRFVHGSSQQRACDALGLSRRTLRTLEEHLRRGVKLALQARGIFCAELMTCSLQRT